MVTAARTSTRRALFFAAAGTLAVALAVVPASGARVDAARAPGAPGAGDPYFPLDGNGGYDVRHYDLAFRYQPRTDVLTGVATIRARSTQRLNRFNLDLVGMTVRVIRVNGAPAEWSRTDHELSITPQRAIRTHRPFTVRVRYAGVPQLTVDELGTSGFIATDDGFDIAGQPHVAATWFPVNDHPRDKASYTFRVTAPRGREVVANGHLVSRRARGPWTTWVWDAPSPMASYLATVDVGEFRTNAHRDNGIRFFDALDPDLFDPVATPSTGTHFLLSQRADSSYKRLTRMIDVPADGATVSFTITRNTETDWDFVMVEAHTAGQDDWTTLPDENGHTTQETGNSCLLWPDLHPFIAEHYQTIDQAAETCEPTGATGSWWAASGLSDGPEAWKVDLAPYAGSVTELSISYVSDDTFQANGAFVDDVVVSTGGGSTSFESGLGGWSVPGPPAGSPGNENDWIVGTAEDTPPPAGEFAAASFARQPEIVGFLAGIAGPYPWRDAGGIVDDVQGLGFALETQTRPIYSRDFFNDPVNSDAVVVHELAHQWYGDSLRLKRWRDIWLNEGFATYTEWLWSEHEELGTPQEIFDFFYDDFIPADDPWWDITIGDPGPEQLFEFPVYFRGAMTLHQLRLAVGDDDFFLILRRWAQSRAGDAVTTPQFIRLAERISGQQLDELFQTWLFTAGRPELAGSSSAAPRSAGQDVPEGAKATIATARREGPLRR